MCSYRLYYNPNFPPTDFSMLVEKLKPFLCRRRHYHLIEKLSFEFYAQPKVKSNESFGNYFDERLECSQLCEYFHLNNLMIRYRLDAFEQKPFGRN